MGASGGGLREAAATLARALAVLALFGTAAGCATTEVSPIGHRETFRLEEDEQRLWHLVEGVEQKWANSGRLYDDPAFAGYVNRVAARLTPRAIRRQGVTITIKVVRDPLLNAFAFPNGSIYLHTGILSKIENEAQLATLLGHEMTHFINRHSLQEMRSHQNTSATLATLQVLFAPFGVYGSAASLLGLIGATAAVTGYSRELESEADTVGLELMVAAGYDPHEAPKLFQHIKRDLEEQEIEEPYFFGSHPRLEERVESYTRLLEDSYRDTSGEKGQARFAAHIGPVILENAGLDLAMGRFDSAARSLDTFLLAHPRSARAHHLKGELYRQRGDAGDEERAVEAYANAVRHDPDHPDPHKALGVLYYKKKRAAEAKAELLRYLELSPQAEDRAYIEQYLDTLE